MKYKPSPYIQLLMALTALVVSAYSFYLLRRFWV